MAAAGDATAGTPGGHRRDAGTGHNPPLPVHLLSRQMRRSLVPACSLLSVLLAACASTSGPQASSPAPGIANQYTTVAQNLLLNDSRINIEEQMSSLDDYWDKNARP